MYGYAQEPVALEMSEWRPYVYLENDKPTGFAYAIVDSVFERANIDYEFYVKPWARVYKDGLEKKNYFIPGLGRTHKREKLFQWIGPVTKGLDIYFFKLKSNPIQIKSIEEAKKYSVGAERGSYYQDFLEEHFTSNKRQLVTQQEQLLKMLVAKRINFILLEESMLLTISEKLALAPNLFEKSLFAFSVNEYLAASLNTDKVLVKKLQKAYRELKEKNLIHLH